MLASLTAAAWACLAILSGVLNLWQWIMARRFPLHQRLRDSTFHPSVSILKPLKGRDSETEACLRSWLQQEYAGPVQFLFGVADPNDPVCALVRELIAAFPRADTALVIAEEQLGFNAKVSTLVQLERKATHEVIVISDADVEASPDLLTNLVAPLENQPVGLVNCFYQFTGAANVAMSLEQLAVNADFWSQVLQSRSLKPIDFALGAVMATTRTRLREFGGFITLVNHLADDYQLGHQIAAAGGRIELCPVVVQCRTHPMSWRDVWTHQLRWTRTIRVCQPAPFFFSILNNATLWPLLWALIDRSMASGVGAGLLWLLRMITARSNEFRLTQRPASPRDAFLPLVKDMLAVGLWALAFMGSEIEWRGRRFRIRRNGTLTPVRCGSGKEI